MKKQDKSEKQNKEAIGSYKLFMLKILLLYVIGIILSTFFPFSLLPRSMMKPSNSIYTDFKIFLSDKTIEYQRDLYMLNKQVYSFQLKDYDGDASDGPPYVVCGVYSYELAEDVKYYNKNGLINELNDRLANKYNFKPYYDKDGNQKWIEIEYIEMLSTGYRKFRTIWFPIEYLDNFLTYRNQIDENTRFIPKVDDGRQPTPDEGYRYSCVSAMDRQENSLMGLIGYEGFGEEFHRFITYEKLQQERARILRVLSAPDTVVRVDAVDGLIYFYNLHENRMVILDRKLQLNRIY